MTIETDLEHLVIILDKEYNNCKKHADLAKLDGDMNDYNYFMGQKGGFGLSINLLKKILKEYGIIKDTRSKSLKACKCTVKKVNKPTKRSTTIRCNCRK